MVVRVKDGRRTSPRRDAERLYGDGMTALVNVKDDTSVTVTVEASIGDFEFENQWYMSLYDFDTQKNADRQVEGPASTTTSTRTSPRSAKRSP